MNYTFRKELLVIYSPMWDKIKSTAQALTVGATLLLQPADAQAESFKITIEEIFKGDGMPVPRQASAEDSELMKSVLQDPKVVDAIGNIRSMLVEKDSSGREFVRAIGTLRHVPLDGPGLEKSTHVLIEPAQFGKLFIKVYVLPNRDPVNVDVLQRGIPQFGSIVAY